MSSLSPSVSLSKDKLRTAEGTAVVHDPRESAKLGVSFSYCKSFVLFACYFLCSLLVLMVAIVKISWNQAFYTNNYNTKIII